MTTPKPSTQEWINLNLPELNPVQVTMLEHYIADREREAYNSNARDCFCDSPGATENVIPHHHLITDGESHDIRPTPVTQQTIKERES